MSCNSAPASTLGYGGKVRDIISSDGSINIDNQRDIVNITTPGGGGATSHSLLGDLTADDHPQYLPINGTRAMTGNLNLNSNDLINTDKITTVGNIVNIGDNNTTTGAFNIVVGSSSVSTGSQGIAMGKGAVAGGLNSLAVGNSAFANNTRTTAVGVVASATGDSSTALGSTSNASGIASLAVGYLTTASGNSSTAIGHLAEATGNNNVALGASAEATGTGSIQIGAGTNNVANSTQFADHTTFKSGNFQTNNMEFDNNDPYSMYIANGGTISGMNSTISIMNHSAMGSSCDKNTMILNNGSITRCDQSTLIGNDIVINQGIGLGCVKNTLIGTVTCAPDVLENNNTLIGTLNINNSTVTSNVMIGSGNINGTSVQNSVLIIPGESFTDYNLGTLSNTLYANVSTLTLPNLTGKAAGSVLTSDANGVITATNISTGGSLTPWTSNIDADLFSLYDVKAIGSTTATVGDIYYNNGTKITPLAKGTSGTVLTMGASIPSWATPASGGPGAIFPMTFSTGMTGTISASVLSPGSMFGPGGNITLPTGTAMTTQFGSVCPIGSGWRNVIMFAQVVLNVANGSNFTMIDDDADGASSLSGINTTNDSRWEFIIYREATNTWRYTCLNGTIALT